MTIIFFFAVVLSCSADTVGWKKYNVNGELWYWRHTTIDRCLERLSVCSLILCFTIGTLSPKWPILCRVGCSSIPYHTCGTHLLKPLKQKLKTFCIIFVWFVPVELHIKMQLLSVSGTRFVLRYILAWTAKYYAVHFYAHITET